TRGAALLDLDPSDGTRRRIVRLPFRDVQSIAVGGGAVWVASSATFNGPGMVVRVDPTSGRITGRATVAMSDGTISGIAYGFGAVWLALQPWTLVRIDAGTLRITNRIQPPTVPRRASSIGGGTANLVVGDDAAWWNGTDTGSIWRVDPDTA